MLKLERMDEQWYEVVIDTKKPIDIDSVIKQIEERDVIPDLCVHELRNGDQTIVSRQIVKDKVRIGNRWEQYPYMTCVSKVYEPHKWWQFWKWHKLVGYEMRYDKEDGYVVE